MHTPYDKKDPYNSLSFPVYNSVAYEFDSAEAMEEAFCGRTAEHTYSRITNPTVRHFEKSVQDITGAASVTALNSGMAAIANTFLTIARCGSNIITSSHLFGNTYSLFNSTLRQFGVEARFCDLTSPEAVRSQVDENTCAIYLEILTNPQLEVSDLSVLSAIAAEANIPLVADTTVIPFPAFNARKFGVDIEIVSSTKYISGGATGLGGLIIDYQTDSTFTTRLRKEIHRNLGSYMTPQTAYMQTLGLETLEVRYQRQSHTCMQLAESLQSVPGIESVNYTGLKTNRFHDISTRQFGKYPGAMLTIDLASREACFRFMNRLKLIRRATNLFDNKTLAIHPGSTIYGNFTEVQRQQMDISQKTIRISVGLEHVEDLIEDIRQALS